MLVRKTQAWEGGGREGDESNVREKASRRDKWRQGRNQRACVLCPNTNQNPDHMCVLCVFVQRALPQLAPLMWDSSPRVREAMTDLLLCIS